MKKELTLRQRVITLFLTILFVGYVGNVSFFTHEHKIGDVVIVHSHPFASASQGHSASALNTISIISHFDTLQQEVSMVEDVLMNLISVLEESAVPCVEKITLLVYSLRAPPVL